MKAEGRHTVPRRGISWGKGVGRRKGLGVGRGEGERKENSLMTQSCEDAMMKLSTLCVNLRINLKRRNLHEAK